MSYTYVFDFVLKRRGLAIILPLFMLASCMEDKSKIESVAQATVVEATNNNQVLSAKPKVIVTKPIKKVVEAPLIQSVAKPQLQQETNKARPKKKLVSDSTSTKQAAVAQSSTTLPSSNQAQTTAPSAASSTTTAATSSSALMNNAALNASANKFSGNFALMSSTDFKEVDDDTKSYAGMMSLALGYRINPKFRANIATSLSKDFSNSFEEQLNNTSLALIRNPIVMGDLLLVPSVAFIYPTSKVAKVRDEMNGAISLTPTLVYLASSRWTFLYVPSFLAYSHKYTTNRLGAINNKYLLSQTLGATYSLNDQISFYNNLSISQRWSYAGNQKDNQYSTDVGATYAFANRSSLSAGISTGGLLNKVERGPDNNIEFFDENASSFYLFYGKAF
jgi:hypothetical protein